MWTLKLPRNLSNWKHWSETVSFAMFLLLRFSTAAATTPLCGMELWFFFFLTFVAVRELFNVSNTMRIINLLASFFRQMEFEVALLLMKVCTFRWNYGLTFNEYHVISNDASCHWDGNYNVSQSCALSIVAHPVFCKLFSCFIRVPFLDRSCFVAISSGNQWSDERFIQSFALPKLKSRIFTKKKKKSCQQNSSFERWGNMEYFQCHTRPS